MCAVLYITPGLHEMNPIYSPKDFLEVLTRVRNSNYNPGVDCGGLMKLNVNVKSLTQLVSGVEFDNNVLMYNLVHNVLFAMIVCILYLVLVSQ